MTKASIGKIFHLTHVVKDFFPLMEWYDRVFTPRHFVDHKTESFPYWEVEKRNANLIAVCDTVIEPMAPATQVAGWDEMPIGRFVQRFGERWHSFGWYVDDITAIYEDLKANDIRVFGNSGASTLTSRDAIFTHPKDTSGMLEFMEHLPTNGDDPRFLPGWGPSWWAENHPLGLERLQSVTVVVRDVERAAQVYENALGARTLLATDSALNSTRNIYQIVGADTIVELAQPLASSSLAGEDLARNGEFMHATTWKVTDLDKAIKYLSANGVSVLDRDETTIVTDPADTFGAVFRFTIWDGPGR